MSNVQNFPGRGNLTLDQLSQLPTAQLVELFNAKSPKGVTSTPTKAKFVPRVWALYADSAPAQASAQEPVESAAKEAKPAKAPKAPKEPKPKKVKEPKVKKERGPVAKPLTFPARTAEERRQANSGTKVEKLLIMAARDGGVNEAEFKKATGAKDRFRSILKWASGETDEGLGYGFKETEPGRVILVDGSGRPMTYISREDAKAQEEKAAA